MNFKLPKEFIPYVLIGCVGTALDFGIFYLGIFLGLPLIAAQWIGASVGFIHNYLWHHFRIFEHNRRLVFTSSFSITLSLISITASGPLIVFTNEILRNLLASKILISILIAIMLFLIRKKWIFTQKPGINQS